MISVSAKKQKLLKDGEPGLQGEHIREGLTAIVSVKGKWLFSAVMDLFYTWF